MNQQDQITLTAIQSNINRHAEAMARHAEADERFQLEVLKHFEMLGTIKTTLDQNTEIWLNHIKRAEPMVKTFENVGWLKSTVLQVAVTLTVIIGAIIALKEFIPNLIALLKR